MTTDFELTEAELDTIRKFIASLSGYGVQCHLTLLVAEDYGDGEIPAKSVDYAIKDLADTCEFNDGIVNAPQDVVDVAPSLALVVKYASRVDEVSAFQFPEDFLPSDKLVEKCLDRFFDSLRARA